VKVLLTKEVKELEGKFEKIFDRIGKVVKDKLNLDVDFPDLLILMPEDYKPNATTIFLDGKPHTMLLNERVVWDRKVESIAHESLHCAGILTDDIVEKFLTEISSEIKSIENEVKTILEDIEKEIKEIEGKIEYKHEVGKEEKVENIEITHELPRDWKTYLREFLSNYTVTILSTATLKAIEKVLEKKGKVIPLTLIGSLSGVFTSIGVDSLEGVSNYALVTILELMNWISR